MWVIGLCILLGLPQIRAPCPVGIANDISDCLEATPAMADYPNWKSYALEGDDKEFKDKLIKLHNKFRAKEKPCDRLLPQLRWNDDLAKLAQKLSNRCNYNHEMTKYGQYGIKLNRSFNKSRIMPSKTSNLDHVGQNMGIISSGDMWCAVEILVMMWYLEGACYHVDSNKCDIAQCGHFKQLTEETTVEIGCGYQCCPRLTCGVCSRAASDKNTYSNPTEDPWHDGTKCSHILVCNYWSSGNLKEYPPYSAKCDSIKGSTVGPSGEGGVTPAEIKKCLANRNREDEWNDSCLKNDEKILILIIIGGLIGLILIVALVVGVGCYCKRRQERRRLEENAKSNTTQPPSYEEADHHPPNDVPSNLRATSRALSAGATPSTVVAGTGKRHGNSHHVHKKSSKRHTMKRNRTAISVKSHRDG